MADFVFHDPSGRRARRIGLAIGLILSFIAAIGAGFAVTLAMAPHLARRAAEGSAGPVGAASGNAAPRRLIRPNWTRVPRPGVLRSAAAAPSAP